MSFARSLLVFLCLWATATATPVVRTLLVPDSVTEGAPTQVNLAVLNPGSVEERTGCPDTIQVVLRTGASEWPAVLRLQTQARSVVEPGAFIYVTYRLDLPDGAVGQLVLETKEAVPLRAVFVVQPRNKTDTPEAAGSIATAPLNTGGTEPALAQFRRAFTDRFSTHLPIYFIAGLDKPAAKFQFSFKYRILGDNSNLSSQFPSLHSLYFGYTQRSLWDITSASSPFYDTSYMPELLYEQLAPRREGEFLQWLGYQVGAQHESNGRDGASSRSLNIAYVRPMVALGHAGDWALVFAPKILFDIDNLSDNPDLRRYRGYAEYMLYIGKNDGPSLTTIARVGSRWDRGSIQLDLNYPIRVEFGNLATYLLVQYFDGYGESLLHYNEKSRTVRAGFGIVR